MSEKVKFEQRDNLKEKPDPSNLGFGQYSHRLHVKSGL